MPADGSDGGADSSYAGGTKTTQVCLPQAQIDKYGVVTPQTRNSACRMIDVVKKTNGMTADMVCSGRMSGKGKVESTWLDDQHAKGKVHFVGAIQLGTAASRPMEWTSESTSTFKSTDCGDVKPFIMPEDL
jgi:hypothetical protein